MDSMCYIWLGIILICSIAEALTLNVVTAWFVFGAILGLIANLAGLSEAWQIGIFVVASFISLIAFRPMMMKMLKKNNIERFNKDALIGQTATVTMTIPSDTEFGEVKLDGKVWRATVAEKSLLDVGTKVEVVSIRGITLTVKELGD